MQLETWLMLFTCIFWSELQAVLGSWDKTCTPFTRSFGPHPSGICGRRIDETLSLLCMGDYNEGPSFFRKKRETENNGNNFNRFGTVAINEDANFNTYWVIPKYICRQNKTVFGYKIV